MTATAVEVAPFEEPTVAEPAGLPEPSVAGPDEILLVPLPGEVEERLRQRARSAQVPLADVVASWLAAAGTDAPVPTGVAGAVNVLLPSEIVGQVRAEAKRRSLQPGQVAAARLASVAGRS
jgi:hypothetical protein